MYFRDYQIKRTGVTEPFITVSIQQKACQGVAALFDFALTHGDEKSDHRGNAVLISRQMKSGKQYIFPLNTDSNSKNFWSWQ